jgi:hypothetical protein
MRITLPHLRRSAFVVTASLALALAAACGGDSGTNPNSDAIEGTYSLKTVDGSPLPYKVQIGTDQVTLTKDVLTVASNGSWTESLSYTQTVNGQTSTGTEGDGGTWTRAGSSVSFYSTVYDEASYTGTYSNRTLTVTYGGSVMVFVR